MLPAHLPLLLASDRFASADEQQPLDKIRMQKGVFLLEQNGRDEWKELFPFRPYNWGPYSRELASTVSTLLSDGRLEREATSGRYAAYKTTPRGEANVEDALAELTEPECAFIRDVRVFVTTRSFSALLRDVYAAYPEYAVASWFAS